LLLYRIRIKSGADKRNWKYPEETFAHKEWKRKGWKRSSLSNGNPKKYPISVRRMRCRHFYVLVYLGSGQTSFGRDE